MVVRESLRTGETEVVINEEVVESVFAIQYDLLS